MTRCCFFFFLLLGSLHAQPARVSQADSLLGLGEWEAARLLLEESLQQHPQPDTTRAWLLHRLGGVLYYSFEYAAAAEKLEAALTLREKLLPAQHPQLAQTIYMQGVLMLVQNKFAAAEQKLLRATGIWERQSPLPLADLADTYQLLGKLYSQIGDFGRGEVLYEKALTYWDELYGQGPEVADLFLLRSGLYDRQKRPIEALRDLRRAAGIYSTIGDPYYDLSLAHCWQNMGLAYLNMTPLDSALYYLEKAETRYAQIARDWADEESRKALFDNWDNQGIVLRKMERWDEAQEKNSRALDSLKAFYSHAHPDLAPTYDNLGDLAREKGERKKSLTYYREGISCLRMPPDQWADPALATKLLLGKARAFEKGESDSVLQAVRIADTLLRYLRESYLEDSSRLMLTQDYLQLYELGVEAALELQDEAAAFYFLGAGRAALLRSAINRTQAAAALGVPDSLRHKTRMLQAELSVAGQDDRVALLAELRELGQYLDHHYPAFAALREPRQPSLEEFREELGKEAVALLCFWGERQVYLMEIGKKRIRWHSTPTPAMKAALLPLLEGQQNPQITLQELRKRGLTFVQDFLPLDQIVQDYQRLLVLPDGLLARVSWAGLPHPEGGWMVERVAIRTAAAAELAFEAERGTRQGNRLYALAPHYPDTGRWPDLPMARSTALVAAQLLEGRADTGHMATLNHFYAFAPDADILHIGAHGLLSDVHPLEGGILLSDSILQVANVYGMELSARLAVLTACHSGGGERQRGEGILSLARAFAHAGCHSLLSSHWEASADATAEISVYFYERLKDGEPADFSLQQSQIQYLKQAPPERRHPYYWAGLTLTGAAAERESKGKWWVVGGMLLLGLVTLVFSRRRRMTNDEQGISNKEGVGIL